LSRRCRKLARVYPELTLALRVPHKNAPIAEIVEAAERIADALTPHLNMLIKAKYPRNCLETLRKDAQALRAYTEAVEESRGFLGRSNRELTQELAMARDTIREFDAVLRASNCDAKCKSAWKNCKGVQGRMGRPSKRRVAARERSAARRRAPDDERPRLALE